jgi:hypothetical protein
MAAKESDDSVDDDDDDVSPLMAGSSCGGVGGLSFAAS